MNGHCAFPSAAWTRRPVEQRLEDNRTKEKNSLSPQISLLQLYQLCTNRPALELAIAERDWATNVISCGVQHRLKRMACSMILARFLEC